MYLFEEEGPNCHCCKKIMVWCNIIDAICSTWVTALINNLGEIDQWSLLESLYKAARETNVSRDLPFFLMN